MSVPISVVGRKNPLDETAPVKYYGIAQASGEMPFKEMCELASRGSTLTDTDISAALKGIIFAMLMGLKNGRIVRLNDFGSMQVVVKKSQGVEDKKKFHVSQVEKVKITFRPGEDLQDMLKTLKFHLVQPKATTAPAKEDEPEEDENGYINL